MRVDVALVIVEIEVGLVVAGGLSHLFPQSIQIAALAVLDEVGQHPCDAFPDAFDLGQILCAL